jgi:hypothetical protein
VEEHQFSRRELSAWLVGNCDAFEFEPHTPLKNKVYNVLMEVDLLLGPLVKLGLISHTGLVDGNDGDNKSLVYTSSGRLLGLIIDSFDPDKRLKDNHQIFEAIQSYLSSIKSTKHQFFLHLLTLYHEQDRLDDLTEIVRKVLGRVAYVQYSDLMDIYEVVSVSDFSDLEKAKEFINNWKTALNNLEPWTRNLLLHEIKLEYEARMGDHKELGDASLYEEHRFELRGNPEETALQAKCIKCNIVQNFSDKTSNVVMRNFNRPLHIKCPECNNINCLVIPSLRN